MQLTQLQYFMCISECGSFTKAAEQLHITQPSLSKAIAELEVEAGTTLLLRTKSGVQLTQKGQIVLEQVRNILRETDELSEMFRQMRQAYHALKIGIPPTMGYCFIPEIMGRVSIIPSNCIQMDNLEYRKFRDVEDILFVAQDHPLANEKSVTADMIANERFVLFNEEYNQNVPFEKLFNNGGFYPKRVTYTSQLSTALNYVEKNIAVSVMIRDIWEMSPHKSNFRAISFDPPYHLELVLAWRKQSHLSWVMRDFIRAVSKSPTEI